MNQNMLLVIAASVGLAAGAGGTYLATSGPDVYSQAIAKAELVAAISADPSLCAVPMVEMPSEEQALAAFRKVHARLATRMGSKQHARDLLEARPV
ncbi:hypothetical protein [Ensifer sp. SSB1]|jgi:hypothetical protein|uniref:hypothetical protein n=1 Tax=Ensifer sp. SSB1 TaxID=2795385 RepID=UPI0025B83F09|nr:hypothetical protein [Ensifer sp. SSB1]